MVNLKSLFAIIAVVSFLLVVLGLVRFGVDLWSYYHASDSGAARVLNYRGLGAALSASVLFAVFILLFWLRKN
jgi:uncharacterized BrkB/YihY/UPF0761 family membrane protein